jgi:type I restriction enzyme S subunit
MVIRGRKDVCAKFLFHFLTSRLTTGWLQHLAESRSGTFPQITFDEVASLKLRLPPLDLQREIAALIDTFDDKIELNRRMNATLESMTRTIFKSWFLDPKSKDYNWSEGRTANIASISRETLTPENSQEEPFDHYSIPAFDEGQLPSIERGATIKSNKFIVPPNSILISKLNPRIPRVWFPLIDGKRRSICSTEFLVVLPHDGVPREWLHGLLSSAEFLAKFGTFVTGTSGSHQRVKPESLLAMLVRIPPKAAMARFATAVAPILSRIGENLRETQILADIRNALLPKLIGGEVLLVREMAR